MEVKFEHKDNVTKDDFSRLITNTDKEFKIITLNMLDNINENSINWCEPLFFKNNILILFSKRRLYDNIKNILSAIKETLFEIFDFDIEFKKDYKFYKNGDAFAGLFSNKTHDVLFLQIQTDDSNLDLYTFPITSIELDYDEFVIKFETIFKQQYEE